jgi:DNA-binding NarL/FixJ family response regulator
MSAGSGSAAEADRPPIRVVVCDDQDLVRSGFVTILDAQPDLQVVGEAADGQTAIRLIEQKRPDVVVMDIRMPRMDGIEATRRIAGPGVDDPAKVLIVTTFNLDALVFDALRAGASGFLLKDARPSELLHAIRTVAAGESLLSPAVTRTLIGRYAERLRPASSNRSELDVLTTREQEVLALIAEGLSNAEIAVALIISHETVKTYVSRILGKLDLRDRVQAVVYAHRLGLVDFQ